MHAFAVWLRFIAVSMCLSIAAAGAHAQVAGKDFQPVVPPQPTETGGKVEVVEFFSYACPHCNTLQSPLRGWLKRKPADVEFRRIPAVFQDSWLPFARIYYTLESMNLVERLHYDVFTAIHNQKLRLQDPKTLFDWVASKGVDRKKFTDNYNSFTVQSRTQRAADVTRRYDVQFTPALVVNGRFLTGPSMTATGSSIDYDRFFKVLDQLVAASRKNVAAK